MDGIVTQEITYGELIPYYDALRAFCVHMCGWETCPSRDGVAFGMHPGCHATAVSISTRLTRTPDLASVVPPAFLTATEYTFPLSAADERRRAYRIQHALAQRLVAQVPAWLRPLPLELWMMVAKCLTRECAIITARELVASELAAQALTAQAKTQKRTLEETPDETQNETKPEAQGEAKISLDKPVYASYVVMEGQYYVRRLFNEDPQDSTQTAATSNSATLCLLLFPGRLATKALRVRLFMASDHLGVRRVRFFRADTDEDSGAIAAWCRHQAQAPMHGVAWNCTSVDLTAQPPVAGPTLDVESDVGAVFFVRGLGSSSSVAGVLLLTQHVGHQAAHNRKNPC